MQTSGAHRLEQSGPAYGLCARGWINGGGGGGSGGGERPPRKNLDNPDLTRWRTLAMICKEQNALVPWTTGVLRSL